MACSLVLSAIIAATSSEPSPSRFVIAGYAPDYRLESLDLTALAHNLTDVLLFSIAPTPQGTIDPGGITQIHHMRAARAKKAAPHLRVLVSMGGGGRSAAFPQAVGSRQRREALAKALVKYCKRGKLDGADIDYEAALGPTELRNLVGFLKLLRHAFDAAAPPLQLTMAVHPQHAEALAPAYAHVHRVHLMAYGQSPRLELCHAPFPQPGRSALLVALRLSPPFRLGPADLPGAEGHAAPAPVRAAIDGMLAAGCPRAKLVLGLPFYGRSLEQPGHVVPRVRARVRARARVKEQPGRVATTYEELLP